ncbi:MAG TPA: aminodeoxychorismate/anthranilate synthase component II [Kiritimatiellia bacterium]|nr:aminodeoxychorismate/anthranilate synthase component II [Kiritimatiellia bacterium]HNS79952.1 aminodeoxychorismate/anthranilate synthase component II [Kiritimatiellia bacterium]HPA78707.1 aminodeoxychorismate/anthranilate synthase component II [Kiritimatiellia bacterium]HQQ04344.1 aminodeoxychorismate/anthranilate synthase component II [Kiritimatiellia bacterium]
MILVLDNYDSFTYNLVQYMGEMGADVKVVRNDAMTPDELCALKPEKALISPGPCTPDEAGVSCEIIRRLGPKIPVLGVCLGHQCIGQVYGGRVIRASRLMHGKTSPIRHNGEGVFRGMPQPFEATRYHSLLVERASLPECLKITAETEEGEIMGLQHAEHPVHGVQFHPESILTQSGRLIIQNFLKL